VTPVIKNLWNIGIKIADLDREVKFLKAVGAELILREKLPVADEDLEYAIMTLGGMRLLLFPKIIFEDRITGGVAPGLTHAVFEVDDCEREFARIKALGGEVLIEPVLLSAGLGTRRVAFFRTPGGFVFEVLQIIESKVP
jgi:catechol 2,3-dioxygenase-like lactoylglutathione lyase family enzyme